jgi:hypothetical protein
VRQDRLGQFEHLRRRAWRWAQDHRQELAQADPTIPTAVLDNPRAADSWRPLIAVGDAASPEWGRRIREAAVAGVGGAIEREGPGVVLLADVRDLFRDRRTDRLSSADITDALVLLEDKPWPEWKNGKPLSKKQLGSILKRFSIRPTTLWIGGQAQRGYERQALEEAWARYLPPLEPQEPQGSSAEGKKPAPLDLQGGEPLADVKQPDDSLKHGTLADLAVSAPGGDGLERIDGRGDAFEAGTEDAA